MSNKRNQVEDEVNDVCEVVHRCSISVTGEDDNGCKIGNSLPQASKSVSIFTFTYIFFILIIINYYYYFSGFNGYK